MNRAVHPERIAFGQRGIRRKQLEMVSHPDWAVHSCQSNLTCSTGRNLRVSRRTLRVACGDDRHPKALFILVKWQVLYCVHRCGWEWNGCRTLNCKCDVWTEPDETSAKGWLDLEDEGLYCRGRKQIELSHRLNTNPYKFRRKCCAPNCHQLVFDKSTVRLSRGWTFDCVGIGQTAIKVNFCLSDEVWGLSDRDWSIIRTTVHKFVVFVTKPSKPAVRSENCNFESHWVI